MIFSETKLSGAYVIEIEKLKDDRGFFARTWDREKFEELGLDTKLSQCSVSFNKKAGTIRGMHYQIKPHQEVKLVRCTKGKIFDVIIDLRENSKTFMKWFGVELSSQKHKMLHIPEGFAHGFQTLEDNTEVFYQISKDYMPEYARGKLYSDPIFNISWPIKSPIVSEKDQQWLPESN
jgi:dTDP-4-dehydrorhamnose 3,5-epimerase